MDIICDIDGTVADCSHRLHWIQSKPKNWKAFFQGMEFDTPIVDTITVIQSLYGSYNNIIFCTGRPNNYREITRAWLSEHVGDWTDKSPLYMRNTGDNRPDYEAKALMHATMILDGYNPRVAFEDRDQVVEMWRNSGLTCYQVAKGTY
jgi:hypothetical protein